MVLLWQKCPELLLLLIRTVLATRRGWKGLYSPLLRKPSACVSPSRGVLGSMYNMSQQSLVACDSSDSVSGQAFLLSTVPSRLWRQQELHQLLCVPLFSGVSSTAFLWAIGAPSTVDMCHDTLLCPFVGLLPWSASKCFLALFFGLLSQ